MQGFRACGCSGLKGLRSLVLIQALRTYLRVLGFGSSLGEQGIFCFCFLGGSLVSGLSWSLLRGLGVVKLPSNRGVV